ncbi:DNA polymerase [Mycoplasmopsis bovis]|uniref:DNA polymerase n=1 Tax=Mycoplasmopsis bovis TaxID=28903 RepID=UPI00094B0B1C|nr:DNA polymerase [Mycoplasmopsis bovis]
MRKPQIIKVFCDTETYKEKIYDKENDEYIIVNRIYLLGVLFDTPVGQHKYFFHSVKEFIDFLNNLPTMKNFRYVIEAYFYNATYDITALNYELYLLGYQSEEPLIISHKEQINEKSLFISARYFITNKWSLIIKDLWAWDKTKKLAVYTNMLSPENEQKGLLDYDKWDLTLIKQGEQKDWYFEYKNTNGKIKTSNYLEEINYLTNDILVLPKIKNYIEKTQQEIFNILNINLAKLADFKGITIPGFSIFTIGQYLDTEFNVNIYDKYRAKITEDKYIKQRKSYFGGYTSYNLKVPEYQCKKGEYIYSFDVNSMYPSFIINELLPYGEMLDYETTPPKTKNIVKWLEIKYTTFNWKRKYKCLFTNPLKKSLDCNVFYITEKYFKLLKTMCNFKDLQVRKKYQYADRNLANLFKLLYELKSNAKNIEEKTAAKLLLNSFYGKLAERSYNTKYSLTNEYILNIKDIENPTYKNTLTGLFITNCGRYTILKTIKDIIDNGDIFLYSDTDSVKFVSNKKLNEINYIDIDNVKPGSFKHEGTYDYFICPYKNKRYLIVNHKEKNYAFASGGFNREILWKLNLKQLKLFFSYKTNILCKKMDIVSKKNKWLQKVLENTDIYTTNKKHSPTHILSFKTFINEKNKIDYKIKFKKVI